MSKTKKTDFKRTLIRNVELPLPKTVVTYESSELKHPKNVENPKENVCPETSHRTKSSKFEAPELYSTLKLSQKVEEIVKPKKTKSTLELEKKQRLALDEKASRLINFPFEQPIYKDLVPLGKTFENVVPVQVNRGPQLAKDKEPDFSDYFTQVKGKDHFFLASPNRKENKGFPVEESSLRLYKVLELHQEI